ncbi:copper uptake system-associated protein [Rhizobium binxianense]
MKIYGCLLAGLLAASAATAEGFTAGDIRIEHAASHAMVPGARVGDGYLTITNNGDRSDKLVSASSDRAGSVQLHRMKIDNGIMVMRELKDGLDIPAHQTVRLEPDYHLMFMDVEKPFRQGEEVKATLTFEKAGRLEVRFAVGRIAGPLDADGENDHSAMNMPGMDMGAMQMPDDPQQAVPATLKAMFETADKPLTVDPVAVQGDWAIAGWRQDGRGGRALLKKGHHGWNIYLCSGDDIREAAALEKVGLSPGDATILSARLKDAESTFDPEILALFASFEGTVMMAGEADGATHGGHEGHAQ